MASIAAQVDATERLRTYLPSTEDRKGLLLSHLIGFALFSEFALNFFRVYIPLTPITSIPIRLVAVWLLIDRTNRTGRLRLGFWDYLIFSFVIITTIGTLITATMNPMVPIEFEDVRRFVGVILGDYLYYLVAREALQRRGFRPDIAIKWLLVGLAWSAIIGVLQALNLVGARSWSMLYADPLLTALRDNTRDENSSFASGTANWWTTMALEMLVGFALVFSPTFRRRPKWWEWGLGLLFMGAFIATQSRGGLLAFGTCAIATFIWFLYHKKYSLALIIGTVFTIAVGIWVFAVFALKIEKFTVSLAGEKVKGSAYGQSLVGRMEQQRHLAAIGMKLPIFGTGPNARLLPGAGAKYLSWSAYTHSGPTDTMYGYVFAQFGVVGLIFLVVMQAYFLTFIRRATAYRPYAFTAFFLGVAFTAHGLAEFLLYQRTFIVMNLLAAFATAPDMITEKGKALYSRVVRSRSVQA